MNWTWPWRDGTRARLRAELVSQRATAEQHRAEMEQLSRLLDAARRDAERLADAAATAAGHAADLRSRLVAAEGRLAQAEQALAEQAQREQEAARQQASVFAATDRAAREEAPEAHPGPLVDSLMGLADSLADIEDPQSMAPAELGELIHWLEGEVNGLLEDCGVTRFADSAGRVDAARHQVVATRGASDLGLVGHIADSVRPGYAWQGATLRPQIVIVYSSPAPPMRSQANEQV